MISLFLGLTLANLICLCGAAGLGYLNSSGKSVGQWHVVAGALAAIVCCAVHCVVFTYFVATAKWIRHAIAVKGLDPALALPTRSFKAMAFPAALGSMTLVFVASCLGAASDAYRISGTWHHLLALTSIAANVAGAAVEYHAISRNGILIDDILARIGIAQRVS